VRRIGGARFRVAAHSSPSETVKDFAKGGRVFVLLVEDHDDTRDAAVMYLKVQKLQVTVAVTGLQAIAMARKQRPDVIVMDLGLPGMDGWEAARQLKDDPKTRSIPIIALSAHALSSDEERAKDVGCDLYIRKPCAPSDLVAAILKYR
jgi:two-component system, cell cycle response regulator DivK